MSGRNYSCRPGEVNSPLAKIILYIVLLTISVFFLFPFFWMLSTAFKKPGSVFLVPIQWIPNEPTLENFWKVFAEQKFHIYIWNSVWLCTVNLAAYLVSCSLVAYAFATQKWKHKNKLFILILATMMLPKDVVFYPQFILFRTIGLYGTMAPLWIPAFFADAFHIFLIRQFFLTIPTELAEAAKIDGCSRFRTYWNIYLPLSKAGLASSGIIIFMYFWNDFFGPLIYIINEKSRTSALALMYLANSRDLQNGVPQQMCAAIITAIPCLLLYYFCQQYFVAGFVTKGVDK